MCPLLEPPIYIEVANGAEIVSNLCTLFLLSYMPMIFFIQRRIILPLAEDDMIPASRPNVKRLPSDSAAAAAFNRKGDLVSFRRAETFVVAFF